MNYYIRVRREIRLTGGRVLSVDAPHGFEIEDGFADDSGTPNPRHADDDQRVVLSEQGGVTQMVATTTFPSSEPMEQLLAMGM